MPENPLKPMEILDPELCKLVSNTSKLALGEGAIPRKYKILMAMAMDADHGAIGGVRSLALQAMEAGATKAEIAEAVRVAQYVGGVGCVYIAAQGLKDIL
jgi:alkylhydroperoxidase/carboxymuconolactone decarboxylase family protein YurZ